MSRQSSNSPRVRKPHLIRLDIVKSPMLWKCCALVAYLTFTLSRFVSSRSNRKTSSVNRPTSNLTLRRSNFIPKPRHHSPLTSYGRKISPDLHDSHLPPLRKKYCAQVWKWKFPIAESKYFLLPDLARCFSSGCGQ